jgi:hypothetical protein
MTPALSLWTNITLLTLLRPASALDVTLQRFKEPPALYYDHIEEAQLYNMEWRILTYINLQEADQNLETVKKYAQLSLDFCKNHGTHIGLILLIVLRSPAVWIDRLRK